MAPCAMPDFSTEAMAKKPDRKRTIIADNRKARYHFEIGDVMEAGIALSGTEVKSLRRSKANIAESYVSPEGGEIWLVNAHIPQYLQASRFNHETRRPRKLLLHKREIARLIVAAQQQGMTIVPLKLYFNDRGVAKVEIALARGKKIHDKRQTEKQRDWQREKARLLRERG